jgi:hypothetical protein
MTPHPILTAFLLATSLASAQAQSSFTKITMGAIVNDGGSSYGCAWGDYDNDGFIDLAVANAGGQNNFLYRNTGNGAFTRILTGPFVTDGLDSIGVIWGDYDNDGFLDLFSATFEPPRKDALYRNNGDGTFTQITTGPQSNDSGAGNSAAWVDYDRDGWLDLFVVNAPQNEFLYHNNADGTFIAITSGPLINSGRNSIASAWSDYDNDGWLDLFVTSTMGAPNQLYRNRGDGTFELDAASPLSMEGGASLGCAWGDYDNDGFLDLFVANGGTNPDVYGESDNYLYHNNGNTNGWLLLKLIGSVSNRSAIGAKLRVKSRIGGKIIEQLREVSGSGQNDLRAHFGLGDAAKAETVRIEWPSGIVQEFRDVAAKQILRIVEPPMLAAISPGRVLVRGAKDVNYAIEVSSDLRAWAKSGVMKGGAEFVDTEANQHPVRYYRAVVE